MCVRLESPFTSIRLFGHHKCLKEMRKDSVAVLLEGSGGDEILGGYEYKHINSFLDQIKNRSEFPKLIDLLLKKNSKKLEYYIESIRDQLNVLKDCQPFLNTSYFDEDFISEHKLKNSKIRKNYKINFLQQSQIYDLDFVNLPRSLKYSDRLAMSCGLENRVPFLDTNLSSFCFNLKNEYKIKDGIERYISKKAIGTMIDSSIFSSEKKAITDPQTIWLKTHLKEFVLDNLHTHEFKEYEILNSKKFIDNFHIFTKKGISSFDIFMNFSSFMFYKNFKKQYSLSFE